MSIPMIVGLIVLVRFVHLISTHTNVEFSLGYHSTTIVNKQASISFLHHIEL